MVLFEDDEAHSRMPQQLASSRSETLLVSAAGDLIACRCRNGPYPEEQNMDDLSVWQEDLGYIACCECDDMTARMQDSAICGPWKARPRTPPASGLLGGAPAQVASPMAALPKGDRHPTRTQQAFRSPPIRDMTFDEDVSIIPIRSFDYSHFTDGGNDMIPEETTTPKPTEPLVTLSQSCRHGIPTFLAPLAQVVVRQVSAHPLGSHVLVISDAGLLYSYGLNDYGQLGIGLRTSVSGFHRGHLMTPSIVTPLVENGGKAIACAAGVNHSLVVVVTEEERLLKQRQNPLDAQASSDSLGSAESVMHHQVYGFGRNDYNKIGLVSPRLAKSGEDRMECVLLPRRVALRAKVRTSEQGIVSIAASAAHSAALVKRASGDVEVYTWGNAMYGALGLPQSMLPPPEGSNVPVVPVPAFLGTVSQSSRVDAESLLLDGELPQSITLGRRSSFVVTSRGRCFSFGSSEEGMLGLGAKTLESHDPKHIEIPEAIESLSAGATHVVALARSGKVYSWGCRIPVGTTAVAEDDPNIAWEPELLLDTTKVTQVCAGYDCTVYVSETGEVSSAGRTSGRLGRGELPEDSILSRQGMFGGLRLWQNPRRKRAVGVPIPRRSGLKRGVTMG